MRLKRRVGEPGEGWELELQAATWMAGGPPAIDKRKMQGRVQAPRRDAPAGWRQAHPARPGRPSSKKRGPGK